LGDGVAGGDDGPLDVATRRLMSIEAGAATIRAGAGREIPAAAIWKFPSFARRVESGASIESTLGGHAATMPAWSSRHDADACASDSPASRALAALAGAPPSLL
jgi:hypothetical protein